MDPFQTLPFEVMESILKLITDLPTLHSLHNASPHVAYLLHEGVNLSVFFETILAHSPQQIRSLIRTIVHLHTYPINSNNNPLPKDYDTFTNPFDHRFHRGQIIPRGYGDIVLPKATPPSVLCRILGLSRRVHQLTHACLHSMISRCNALQPQRLADPRFIFDRSSSVDFLMKKLQRAEGEPIQPVDCGPPCWIEEQRVARAVWRLVLFHELQDAVVTRRLLRWSIADVKRLQSLEADEFWASFLYLDVDGHELKTVLEWIIDNVSNGSLRPWGDTSTLESENSDHCCPHVTPPMAEAERHKQTQALRCSAPGIYLGSIVAPSRLSSPLRFVDFAIFRPNGFAIWELERMAALGFLGYERNDPKYSKPGLSESNLFYTWRSILTEQQKKELEMTQREKWSK
jgi:hypothetical protein